MNHQSIPRMSVRHRVQHHGGFSWRLFYSSVSSDPLQQTHTGMGGGRSGLHAKFTRDAFDATAWAAAIRDAARAVGRCGGATY
jgi:hypothetical protein